jgi:Signal transduction histidine kinase
MKNTVLTLGAAPASRQEYDAIPLHDFVDQLLAGLLPLVVGKKSFIINDIDHHVTIKTDEQVLAYVLGNLLSGAVNGAGNVCIRVEAVQEYDNVQIRVRNNGSYSNGINGFSQVVKAARKLGGDISINNQQNQGTTLTFSIATQKLAC